jgi:hypothetical protein
MSSTRLVRPPLYFAHIFSHHSTRPCFCFRRSEWGIQCAQSFVICSFSFRIVRTLPAESPTSRSICLYVQWGLSATNCLTFSMFTAVTLSTFRPVFGPSSNASCPPEKRSYHLLIVRSEGALSPNVPTRVLRARVAVAPFLKQGNITALTLSLLPIAKCAE